MWPDVLMCAMTLRWSCKSAHSPATAIWIVPSAGPAAVAGRARTASSPGAERIAREDFEAQRIALEEFTYKEATEFTIDFHGTNGSIHCRSLQQLLCLVGGEQERSWIQGIAEYGGDGRVCGN